MLKRNFFCQKCEKPAKHKIRYDEASFYCYKWHPYTRISGDRHQSQSAIFKNVKVTTKKMFILTAVNVIALEDPLGINFFQKLFC